MSDSKIGTQVSDQLIQVILATKSSGTIYLDNIIDLGGYILIILFTGVETSPEKAGRYLFNSSWLVNRRRILLRVG